MFECCLDVLEQELYELLSLFENNTLLSITGKLFILNFLKYLHTIH